MMSPSTSLSSIVPLIVAGDGRRMQPYACSCGGAGGGCSCTSQPGVPSTPSTPTPIYAFGSLRVTFPSKSLELEMQAALERMRMTPGSKQRIDSQTGYALQLLSQGELDHLFRNACFILSIGPIDEYLVQPRSEPELNAMVAACNQSSISPVSYSVVIGPLGPLASPSACNGLQLPIVYCDQILQLEAAALSDYFSTTSDFGDNEAAAMQDLLFQLTDNPGRTPEHRALNYVALRITELYTVTAEMLKKDFVLAQVEAKSSAGAEVELTFTYQKLGRGNVAQWRCNINARGLYPYVISPLSQFFPGYPVLPNY